MYGDARKASKDARLFNKIGIIIGSISLAVSLAMIVLVVIIILLSDWEFRVLDAEAEEQFSYAFSGI